MKKSMKEAIALQNREKIGNLKRMLFHKKITQEEFDSRMQMLY